MRTYPTLSLRFRLHFRLIYGCLWALLLGGCDMIEYHPYDLDIDGETDVNRRHIEQIEKATRGKDEIRFAVISDTQRWYDETEDAVEALNRRGDLDFVVHTGDLSDFGLKLEFEKQRDILNGLNVPYVCLLGNHDCLATGLDVYRRVFGTEDFAFTAGNVRFLCLNTNALEFDNSSAVPNIQYIRDEIDNVPEGVEKTVVAMHAGPFSEQFNNNLAEYFEYYLRQMPGLQFCVYGHGHNLSVDDFFDDGILYYECTCAKKRAYLLFTLNADGYAYEVVDF